MEIAVQLGSCLLALLACRVTRRREAYVQRRTNSLRIVHGLTAALTMTVCVFVCVCVLGRVDTGRFVSSLFLVVFV